MSTKMCRRIIGVVLAFIFSAARANYGGYFQECYSQKIKLSCIADKTSTAIDNAIDADVPLVPGLILLRNESPASRTGRDLKNFSALDRFMGSVMNFADTHVLSLDYGYDEEVVEGRRRRRRRLGLLVPLMMGMFGITGTLVMKTIAIIAGKALIVSKMALMIIGIIGLKKLFAKDQHETSVVQLHAMHDEHDRNANAAMYNIVRHF